VSNLKLAGGDDYPDAAAKHLDDAGALLFANRCDGAAYLSGYVVECSLKSLILLALLPPQVPATTLDKLPQGHRHHRLRELSATALGLAQLTLSGSLLRYAPPPVASAWNEVLRYSSPGVSEDQAVEWLAEAERIYDTSVGKMRLDGVVF
jgi:hypothetical protein